MPFPGLGKVSRFDKFQSLIIKRLFPLLEILH